MSRLRFRGLVPGLLLVSLFIPAVRSEESPTWSQFRGPGGSGHLPGAEVPDEWSRTENIAWSIEVPGRGWSSPIVTGNRVILTSAVIHGEAKKPSTGLFGNADIEELVEQGVPQDEAIRRILDRDLEITGDDSPVVDWLVLCYDARDGKELWRRKVLSGKPPGGRHRKNSYASETPATDGDRVYVYFANQTLRALRVADGKEIWARKFQPRKIYLDMGTGASPIVDGRYVYVVNDNSELSSVLALDRKTGKEAWKTIRHRGAGGVGWASPFLWKNRKRVELVTVGQRQIKSYDPRTGKQIWNLRGITGVPAPTPIAADGMLYVTSGQPDEAIRPVFAIRPGAEGDISLEGEETSNELVAWSQPKAGTYIPTPVVHDGRIYVLHDRGFLGAYDAKSGKKLYKVRLGKRRHFTSSPWVVGDLLFCLSEEGDTFVVKTGDEFELVRVNELDEFCMATPALTRSTLYLRTEEHLYAIRSDED